MWEGGSDGDFGVPGGGSGGGFWGGLIIRTPGYRAPLYRRVPEHSYCLPVYSALVSNSPRF